MKIWAPLLFIIVFSLCSVSSFGQNYRNTEPIHEGDISKLSAIQKMEDTLYYFADSMINSPIPDARIDGSYAFIKSFRRFLENKESYKYDAKKLGKKISVIQAPDKRFKIYTWEIVRSNTEFRYYGALQMEDGSYQPLIDVSDQIIRGAEDSVFYNMRWYGCVYYNILQKKVGEQNAYFLIGYNGNSMNGDKKIVDAFGFDRSGRAIFGAPLFAANSSNASKPSMRFILNYQKNSRVSLNYDTDREMIIFDHCESSVGDADKKNTYVPDGTYDGLKWDGRNWRLQTNAIDILSIPAGQAPVEKPIK